VSACHDSALAAHARRPGPPCIPWIVAWLTKGSGDTSLRPLNSRPSPLDVLRPASESLASISPNLVYGWVARICSMQPCRVVLCSTSYFGSTHISEAAHQEPAFGCLALAAKGKKSGVICQLHHIRRLVMLGSMIPVIATTLERHDMRWHLEQLILLFPRTRHLFSRALFALLRPGRMSQRLRISARFFFTKHAFPIWQRPLGLQVH
jgi:hypothetical protein